MRWALMLSLAACGYPQEEFELAFEEASCAKLSECYPELWTTSADCLDAEAGGELTASDLACDFHAREAKRCLAEVEELACPDQGELLAWPETCTLAYTGCE